MDVPSRLITTSSVSDRAFTTDRHAVQSSNPVASAAELAACVEHGEHYLRQACPLQVNIDGDASAVVLHRHGPVPPDGDDDPVACPCKRPSMLLSTTS